MTSSHNKQIREKIAALEKEKESMSQGSIHYPRINADIQALAAQLEPESLEKQWYEKPIGKIGVGLFVAIISAGFVYYLGWY